MDDDARRNLNPHKPARMAMLLWGDEYAAQYGGSMDFWDKLSEDRKRQCRDALRLLEVAPPEMPGPSIEITVANRSGAPLRVQKHQRDGAMFHTFFIGEEGE